MPRSLALALVFSACASAGIRPEQLGKYHLKSAAPTASPSENRVELEELGVEAGEQADYGPFQVKAERFKNTRRSVYAASFESSPDPTSRVGNYLVLCRGNCPKNLVKLADAALPGVSRAAVPTLSSYLPVKGLVPHSERYIIGPATLRASGAQIPESALAFQFGTEGVFAYTRPRPETRRSRFSRFQPHKWPASRHPRLRLFPAPLSSGPGPW